ncbi:hypothetical protein [Mucilaginibacter segetis]|nr:hypothetical protein [Mucilaginibacter segetis]
MKTYTKTATNKLLSSFDKALMNVLMSDLKTVKAKNQARLAVK